MTKRVIIVLMNIRRLILTLFIGLLAGCASKTVIPLGVYYPKDLPDLDLIRSSVENRNKTIESHPQWRMIASQRIMSRSLEEIPASEYKSFKDYLDDGVMYIIVHPAYYFFFHDENDFFTSAKELDIYINEDAFTKRDLFMREQERSLRDFLEITSTRNRLLLLILPDNYREYSGYKYKYGEDEFARYINEVSNDSKATIYLYSEKPNRGMLSSEMRNRLINFIRVVNPDKIVIGGGYLGRCLEDFYRQLSQFFKDEIIEIEPWISAISPEDLKYFDLDDLIRDGKLDMSLVKGLQRRYSNIKNNSFRELLKNYRNNRAKGG